MSSIAIAADEQLSQHFWLREFLRSEQAARLGITLVPEREIIDNLQRLCVSVLEPIRVAIGRPITITSGWRPQWLNKIVGGSRFSAHIEGRAVDFVAAGMTVPQICQAVAAMVDLPIDQVIQEYPPHGWCHCGIAPLGQSPRGEVLTIRTVNKQKVTTQGLA